MKRLMLFPILLVAVGVAAAPIAPGFVDSTSPIFNFAGSWSTESNVIAIGESVQTSAGGSVSFESYTQGFTLYFLYSPNGNDVDVCIDSSCVTLSTLGGESRGKADFTLLPAGQKAITITASGVFKFDGIYIYPDAPPTDESSLFEFEGETYSGKLENTITTGDALTAILLTVLAVINISQLVIGMWGVK